MKIFLFYFFWKAIQNCRVGTKNRVVVLVETQVFFFFRPYLPLQCRGYLISIAFCPFFIEFGIIQVYFVDLIENSSAYLY